VTDAEIDVFDREAVFLDRTLAPLVKRFPKLKIVAEHITTHEAAAFVERARRTSAPRSPPTTSS
jgi:dihydroorotase